MWGYVKILRGRTARAIRWLAPAWVIVSLTAASALGQETMRGLPANPHGPLKVACGNCHTTTAWRPIRTQPEFNHDAETSFPLRGMHAGVACRDCHVSMVFAKAATQCASCHADVHRRQFGANCQECHTVRGWQVAISAVQQHSNRFPLLGAHAAATCDACHRGAASGVYTGLSTQCVSCHLTDYQNGMPLNHQAAHLPLACESCHTMDRWQGAKFDHSVTSFPLTGAHASLDCASCHGNGRFQALDATCFGCHATDFNKATNPNHAAASLPHDCAVCHTTATWTGAKFDHTAFTSFPLTGAHATVACAQCHLNGSFQSASAQCVGCHLPDFQKAANPNHVTAGFPQDCAVCHTTAQWLGAKFDHSTATKFALTGAHVSLACAQCHANGVFAGTPMQCSGCHLKDFQGASSPNHVAARFSQDCASCHTTSQWAGGKFDHTASTRFALTGAHAAVACALCHVNNVFTGTPQQCAGCHMPDFRKTTNPNHVSAGFPQDCSLCHTTLLWTGAKFDHTASTKFPLTGAHATVDCAQCHANGVFAGTPTACSGCHLPDFQKANSPNHVAASFPQDCAVCHNTTQWLGAKFDHSATKFPLTGAHVSLSCNQCHSSGQFATLPTACATCHMPDFQKANSPNHVAAGFPQDCAICHNTTQWLGAKFDHTAMTKFPLTGAHATLSCNQCHANGQFATLSASCSGCHLTDFQKASNPNHVAAGFPQECQLCHSTASWSGAQFDHSKTRFPLTGAHISLTCNQCHGANEFSTLNAACSGCHMADYQKATSPNHVAAAFPQDCAICHNTTQWLGAKFDHSSTGFALTGAHTPLACAQCHVNNNYSLTSAACVNCHLNDFNGANSPPHKAGGFPQDCAVCHNTTQWLGAKFDHSATGFTLTGAHTSLQCAQCHVNNNFGLTSAACANCHITEYNGTTAPNHKAAAFPLDCAGCHNTTNWGGATFNHASTGFALTGAHAPLACTQCHVNSNYNLTSAACVNCHLTDYNGANSPPHKAGGFPQDCAVCHNTTQWLGAKFDHSATGFTLTGAHTSLQCAQCHVNNNYAIASAACINCHLTDYNGTTNPPHKASGFPQDCSGCHTTANWLGATFNHASTGFTLTGAHTSLQCAQCHVNNNFSLTSAACANCHLTDYNGTTNPAHKAAGFPTTCDTCHNTTNWQGATFNHSSTPFPLTGAHTTVACASCHVNGVFAGLTTACSGCHMNDYNGANNPPHKASGFPTACETCHTTAAWTSATFNHASTGFTLTGAHTSLQCAQCHVNNNYAITSAACINCHLTDYNGTTNPPHKASGFPQDCSGCHTTTNWLGAVFNHAATGFTLTGAHTSLQCAQCHVNNNFSLTSAACINCHLADYNGTTSPSHTAAGFPQDCSMCHTTTNWSGATFTHPAVFPLTGAHATVACALCHVNNVFAGTPTDCYSCHKTDYTGTTNPNHVASQFPTTCASCHNTTTWSGATFNHTWFPIYSGNHAGKWTTCGDCHTNSSDYSIFSCITCHQHAQANTDPNHRSVKNYVYSPTSCYSCHPTGGGG